MPTQEAFMDSVDHDQTAQNLHSDLRSTLPTFFILDYTQLFVHLAMEVYV